MIGWGLNLVYCGLLLLFSPVILFRAIWQGKYRQGWGEKFFGRVAERTSTGPAIWLHAVSVGEVLVLRTILPRLSEAIPSCEFWISTTTHTGYAVAVEKYPDCRVIYFPLDFTWAVRNALQRVRPSLIVLVELELWPNFIRAAAEQSIPVLLINGRMSERSFRGYRRIRWLMARLWQGFARIAVQTEEYRRRLEQLGAPVDRLSVTGSTKYDGLETDRGNARTSEIRNGFGLREDETVFMAGSTQPPEESFAIDTYLALRERHPALRLVLVPRHQERFEEVAALVQSRGMPLLRRSVIKAAPVREGEASAVNRIVVESLDVGHLPTHPSQPVSGTALAAGSPDRAPSRTCVLPTNQTEQNRRLAPCRSPFDSSCSQHWGEAAAETHASSGPLTPALSSPAESSPHAASIVGEREQNLRSDASSPAPAQPELRPPGTPILLLDTLGELGAAWGLADIAFVGGSLTPRGGQNMIEPAAYAAAVLFGPNTGNFRQVVELLLSEQAARVVHTPEDLTRVVSEFLENPTRARQLGETAQRLVLQQQGATARTVDLIVEALSVNPPHL